MMMMVVGSSGGWRRRWLLLALASLLWAPGHGQPRDLIKWINPAAPPLPLPQAEPLLGVWEGRISPYRLHSYSESILEYPDKKHLSELMSIQLQ